MHQTLSSSTQLQLHHAKEVRNSNILEAVKGLEISPTHGLGNANFPQNSISTSHPRASIISLWYNEIRWKYTNNSATTSPLDGKKCKEMGPKNND